MKSISYLRIGFAVTIYLFVLNIVSNSSLESIYLSVVPALIFFLLMLILGLIHKYIYKLVLIVGILIASVTIFFKWRYKVTVTEDLILSGILDDSTLTMELFSFSLLAWILLSALPPIIFIIKSDIGTPSPKPMIVTVVLTLLFVDATIYLQGYKYRKKGQIRDYKSVQAIGSFSPLDVLYAYKKALSAYKNLKTNYQNIRKRHHKYDINASDDRLVVLIVGETTRRDHLSINGYDRKTTPKLEKIKNLYSFTKAKSCDTLTIRSMNYMFSPLECSSYDSRVKDEPFTKILSSLGYTIDLYSLQTLNAFYHYLGYDTLVSKYAVVREQKSGTKDVSLLPYIKKSIEEYKGGKKLIIVHTLGSHQDYNDRVENKYKKFLPICSSSDISTCTDKQLINSYDNTIVAVDDFLSTVIGLLAKKRAMLVYLSDHGESLGEHGHYLHGTPRLVAPKEQFMVPFMFWFSEKYNKTLEAKAFVKHIKSQSLDMNITHDDLFHSVLGCMGIKSADGGINPNLNLCQY